VLVDRLEQEVPDSTWTTGTRSALSLTSHGKGRPCPEAQGIRMPRGRWADSRRSPERPGSADPGRFFLRANRGAPDASARSERRSATQPQIRSNRFSRISRIHT
jgi:hypothetical protein